MSNTYTYKTETYALITNLNRSVLKLNAVLASFGYEFKLISLADLDKNFRHLYSLSPDWKKSNFTGFTHDRQFADKNGSIPEKEKTIEITQDFLNLFMNRGMADGHQLLRDGEIIFLKKIEDDEIAVVDREIRNSFQLSSLQQVKVFADNLVQQLRLLKNGDVGCKTIFQIAAEARYVVSRLDSGSEIAKTKKFKIEDGDEIVLQGMLQAPFAVNELTKLALITFNNTYQILDAQSRYLNFMICLESIFNLDSNQIAHTISRHLAIILSENETEFHEIYKRMKQLYANRNKIIHGTGKVENLALDTEALQNFARMAINYCLKVEMSKKDFHEQLNARGY